MANYNANNEQIKEYIRGSSPLRDVAGAYLELPADKKKPILCFLHNENTPSCFLHPSEEFFKCFGCGKVTDVYALIMHFEKLNFIGALRFLAHRANITLPQYSKKDEEKLTKQLQQKQLEVELFETVLALLNERQNSNGDYLIKRGISKETSEKYECYEVNLSIGEINNFLKEKGFSQELINTSNVLYDTRMFDNSLVMPIRMRGKIVTFCSRTLTDRDPKYLYLTDHIKGIFNYDEAVTKEEIYVCEGPIDTLTLIDKGLISAVSLGSCNASEDQIITLKKLQSKNIFICFDNDADKKDNSGLLGAIKLAKELGGKK